MCGLELLIIQSTWLFVLIKGAYSLTDLAQRVYIESLNLVLCSCHGNKPVLLCHMFLLCMLTEPLMQAIKLLSYVQLISLLCPRASLICTVDVPCLSCTVDPQIQVLFKPNASISEY